MAFKTKNAESTSSEAKHVGIIGGGITLIFSGLAAVGGAVGGAVGSIVKIDPLTITFNADKITNGAISGSEYGAGVFLLFGSVLTGILVANELLRD